MKSRSVVAFIFVLAGLSTALRADGPFVIVSSDFNNSVIEYTTTGTFVKTLVPAGGGGLGSPQGITVGPDGNIYVSSATSDQVLRYAPDGTPMGQFQTGGGLDQPWYLTFGPDKNLYVSSSLTSQVL